MKRFTILIGLLALASTACSVAEDLTMDKRFDRVQSGMTEAQVKTEMGEPDSLTKANAILGAITDDSECWTWGTTTVIEDGQENEVPKYVVCFDRGGRVKSKTRR